MATQRFETKKDVKMPKVKATTDKKARAAALSALVKGVQQGSARIESYLPTLLNKALEADVWSWPRTTLRQNGTTAGTTRDIVDTGRLRDSLKVTTKFLKTKTTFSIAYSAPYAALVHEGGYILPYGDSFKNPMYIPGRPWISAVLDGGVSGIESIDLSTEMLAGVEGAWG